MADIHPGQALVQNYLNRLEAVIDPRQYKMFLLLSGMGQMTVSPVFAEAYEKELSQGSKKDATKNAGLKNIFSLLATIKTKSAQNIPLAGMATTLRTLEITLRNVKLLGMANELAGIIGQVKNGVTKANLPMSQPNGRNSKAGMFGKSASSTTASPSSSSAATQSAAAA